MPVKIVLGPNKLSSGTSIRHCIGSVKCLQAQHRSSQKKTVSTGACQYFLAFRSQGTVESHTLSHFSTKDSIIDVIHCSRTVFEEGKTSCGIFQFSGFRLKDTMKAIAIKNLGRSSQNPISGVDMRALCCKTKCLFSVPWFQAQPGNRRKFVTFKSWNFSFRYWGYLRCV